MPPLSDESRMVRQSVSTPQHLTAFGWMVVICGSLAMALVGGGLAVVVSRYAK